MAFLQRDPASGRFRIRFCFGGQEYKRSLKTREERTAVGIQARVEETIRLLEQGRLEIPVGADPGTFILTDGKLTAKPVVQRGMTLAELFGTYRAKYPAGATESTTAYTERIHCGHLLRIIGSSTPVQTLTTAAIQEYIEKRSEEFWRGRQIKAQTVKIEVATLRVIWNWAVELGLLSGQAPIKGARHRKGREKPPFQTWDEIERTIERGGLTAEEQQELWESLFLTRAQTAEVLAFVQGRAVPSYIYPMFVFVAHTGARRSEMIRSRIEDFHLQDRTVLIREKKRDRSKSVTFRRVDMTPLLVAEMADWFSRHPGGQLTFCAKANLPLTKGLGLPQLPAQFDLKAIGTFLLGYMGLSWDSITSILIKHIGPQNIALVTEAYNFISGLVDLGPQGVYQLLEKKLVEFDPQTLVNQAIDAGKNYLLTNVVPKAVVKIVGLFTPIPASLLLSIYDGLSWFFDQAQTLAGVVDKVVDGIGDVAAGRPGLLATKIDEAMKGLLVPVIDFAARQVPGLGNLPVEIGKLVTKPRVALEAEID